LPLRRDGKKNKGQKEKKSYVPYLLPCRGKKKKISGWGTKKDHKGGGKEKKGNSTALRFVPVGRKRGRVVRP